MKTLTVLMGAALLSGATPALHAQGCGATARAGCCSAAPPATTNHGGHHDNTAASPTAAKAPKLDLSGVAKPVFENYLAAHASLAGDSLEKVSANASALAQAVRADAARSFALELAVQAEALAKAKDLATARQAFRPLSDSLIRYVKTANLPAGTLHEVYCPMAKASWLQAGTTIRNPYWGAAMLNCGQLKN